MTLELTAANLRRFDLDFQLVPGSIQKFRWPRAHDISITLWVCHQHPVSDELLGSLLPYMDVATVWYHDHSSMSCLKVRAAVSLLERSISNIWLLATRLPSVHIAHKSRIQKCYDNNGFLRPCCKAYTLEKGIEEILRSELTVQKSLYRF